LPWFFFALLIVRHDIKFPSYETGGLKITKRGMVGLNFGLFLSGIIYFGGIAYFWYITISKINDVEEIPNSSNIVCTLLKEPYPITHYNILYYNDSYIFIDLWNGNEKQVRVFPIDILLDSAPCRK
jgi:hypothetical protein